MRVACYNTLDELTPYAECWDRLAAGMPFRAWAWAQRWWLHYGQRHPTRRLFVACVHDANNDVLAIAPWFVERSASRGRVLQFLGTGEVCSEYLGVLCDPARVEPAMEALAGWLHLPGGTARRGAAALNPGWDLLRLSYIDKHDGVALRLMNELAARGNLVDCRPGPACWRIELPSSWEEFLARLSKSHRKQVRRLEHRLLKTGRAELLTACDAGDVPGGFQRLVDLHQRRQRSLGQPGCFASAPFTAFHRDVVGPMFTTGQLQLHWMDLDRRLVAAEYHLAGDGVIYVYQGGIDPEALHAEPGRLITLATLRRAIAMGYRAFDFLRGDEPYKAHWRAEPQPTLDVRIIPDRVAARLRHQFWVTGREVRRWLKTGLNAPRSVAAPARPVAESHVSGDAVASMLPPTTHDQRPDNSRT